MQPAPGATWPSWQQPATVSAWSCFLLHPSRQIGTALILQPPNELSLAALSSASPTDGTPRRRIWLDCVMFHLRFGRASAQIALHLACDATRFETVMPSGQEAWRSKVVLNMYYFTILRNKETRWHLIIQHAASLMAETFDDGAFWEGPNTASLYTKSFMNSRRWTAQRTCGRMNSLVNLRMGQKKHFWLTNSWIENWYLCFFR